MVVNTPPKAGLDPDPALLGSICSLSGVARPWPVFELVRSNIARPEDVAACKRAVILRECPSNAGFGSKPAVGGGSTRGSLAPVRNNTDG